MNLELLESFGQNYPEEFDGLLDCVSVAITCAFNRRGVLLAVGCNDGRVVIWDFMTRGIAKVINAHVHPVCSLSWSRSGHKLLTAATDNTVSVWDVLSGELDHTFRFPGPVLKVQFHPRDSWRFLVCPLKHAAVLMDINGEHCIIPVEDETDLNIAATFDRRGDFLYTGNAKGRVLVFQTSDLELCASFRVGTGSSAIAIKQIEFARKGDGFLINSADRVIRIYDSKEVLMCGKDGEPQPIQKLQDLVNRTLWKKCVFSGDGEYIAAGSARQHSVYIYEKQSGTIVKDLHGTKGEVLLDLVWHPLRPVICSISSGVVSVWSQNQVENWSAFAPDFKELDENVEYEERESEFDIEDEDKEVAAKKIDEELGDFEVDVTSVEPLAALLSSDEEDNAREELLYLPVAPEVDEPEEPPWLKQLQQSACGDQLSPTATADSTTTIKRQKMDEKATEVILPDASTDVLHPLLGGSSSRKQLSNSSTNSERHSSKKVTSNKMRGHKRK